MEELRIKVIDVSSVSTLLDSSGGISGVIITNGSDEYTMLRGEAREESLRRMASRFEKR